MCSGSLGNPSRPVQVHRRYVSHDQPKNDLPTMSPRLNPQPALTFDKLGHPLPNLLDPLTMRIRSDAPDLCIELLGTFDRIHRVDLRGQGVGQEVGVFEEGDDLPSWRE